MKRRLLDIQWLANTNRLLHVVHFRANIRRSRSRLPLRALATVPAFSVASPVMKANTRHFFGSNEGTEMSMDHSADGGDYFETAMLRTQPLRDFGQKVRRAFEQLVEGEYANTALPAWRRFLKAYEFRGRFPWLDESSRNGQNGLIAALRQAMRTYDPPEVNNDEDNQRFKRHIFSTHYAHLSSREVSELARAMTALSQDLRTIEHFAYRLSCAGVRIETIEITRLRGHLIHALTLYAERREEGIAQDT